MSNKILSTRDYVNLSISEHNLSSESHSAFFPAITDMQSLSSGWEFAYHSISGLEPKLPDTPLDPTLRFLNGNREWAPISIAAGGYSGNLYFTTLSSDISGYRKISYDAGTTETELTGTVTNAEEVLLRSYVYDQGIDTTVIDAGIWIVNYRTKVSSSVGTTQFRMELFLRHINGSETTLFSQLSEDINNTTYTTFRSEYTAPSYSCVETDRLGARIYIRTTHAAPITVYTIVGDGNGSYFTTPLRIRHNQLRDLDNDDHPQYVLVNGARGITGNLTVSGNISGNSFNIENHIGYTHANKIVLMDSTGAPVKLFLRGGILTID